MSAISIISSSTTSTKQKKKVRKSIVNACPVHLLPNVVLRDERVEIYVRKDGVSVRKPNEPLFVYGYAVTNTWLENWAQSQGCLSHLECLSRIRSAIYPGLETYLANAPVSHTLCAPPPDDAPYDEDTICKGIRVVATGSNADAYTMMYATDNDRVTVLRSILAAGAEPDWHQVAGGMVRHQPMWIRVYEQRPTLAR
ncbi:hypothetical protein K474DRAFT_1660587 [Panus rudis PR-1116 ss-1]|nr:hypothetical protein K474DRAFT_1660587 [Panus rudis PR-1116 ss-1]